MSGWLFILIGGMAFFALLVLLALLLVVPAVTEAVERARLEREAAEASWQIHLRARQAFGDLLDAARQVDHEEQR